MELSSKHKTIEKLLDDLPINISELWELGVQKGGFINNNLRASVWPILLNITNNKIPNTNKNVDISSLPLEVSEQIKKDCDRTFSKNRDLNETKLKKIQE
jgi:hypothetical protein